ncbi:MAG: hypothetical protein NC432_11770 [Roseburia sp.]|nr:hypothetical protein [Roseburia sp.]MCM1099448.1 hypothetical protein [Ruminococcus flavefaciens]
MDYNQNGPDDQQNDWENARENWDRWQEQEKKKDWDKWDSNASKSSYYNQPTHTPYDQSFSLASMACGFLSVTLGNCGLLAIPLGAMGILFAFLCSRTKKRLNSNCRFGFCLGTCGCIYGIVNLITSYIRAFEQLSQYPLQPPAALSLFQHWISL